VKEEIELERETLKREQGWKRRNKEIGGKRRNT